MKYSVDQKLDMTVFEGGFNINHIVKVVEIVREFYGSKPEQYKLEFNNGKTILVDCKELDANLNVKAKETPITLLGKTKGRCQCGAWITINSEHHSYWCPEHKKNGL